jgi:hypothetical protein
MGDVTGVSMLESFVVRAMPAVARVIANDGSRLYIACAALVSWVVVTPFPDRGLDCI